jgi:5-methylcytosine-specific restriction endonuclease McrA
MPHKDPAARKAYMDAYNARRRAEMREYCREWRREHPERAKAAHDAWKAKYPDRARDLWRRMAHRRAGDLTSETQEYDTILRGDPCCYCGAPTKEVDHIVPLASGGDGAWDNLTAACRHCNRSKHGAPLLHFLLRRATV